MQKKYIIRVLIITLLILFIPVFGNLYVDGWNWGPGEFAFGFVMIFGTGLLLTYAANKISKPSYRILACAGIVLAFLFIGGALATG